MTFSVLPTERLWIATLKPLRAKLRARLDPITAIPVTPMSATSAGDGVKLAMRSPQIGGTSIRQQRVVQRSACTRCRAIAAHSRDERRSGGEEPVCCHWTPVPWGARSEPARDQRSLDEDSHDVLPPALLRP